MSKGQKRSNREVKKPKQAKSEKKAATTSAIPLVPERGPARGPRERDLPRR